MVVALIINGFRKLNPAIPLMGNNSAIISAACHPDPIRNDEFLPFKRIRWGATSPPEGKPGHCTFTCDDVPLPIPGQRYESSQTQIKIERYDQAWGEEIHRSAEGKGGGKQKGHRSSRSESDAVGRELLFSMLPEITVT